MSVMARLSKYRMTTQRVAENVALLLG